MKITDKQRLDWISKQAVKHAVGFLSGVIPASYYIQENLRFMVLADTPNGKVPTIRQAIDAAIRASRRKKP